MAACEGSACGEGGPVNVHVLAGGRIVKSGGPEVALALEESGYEEYRAVEEEEPAGA